DIHAIMKQLPHRYPFLLVDRVLECKPGVSLTAVKNVTINEPFFPGHFPQRPVMPGVLILEALAQATGLLAFASIGHSPGPNELYYFVGIDNARFKKPVEPGDQMLLKVEYLWDKRGVWKFKARAEVDGRVVTQAELMCAAQEFDT
ncbi:MAG: 3-hydroxyacyl-ACP dehydratase FabZ, partial [Gammaproteobacteria bacterium]